MKIFYSTTRILIFCGALFKGDFTRATRVKRGGGGPATTNPPGNPCTSNDSRFMATLLCDDKFKLQFCSPSPPGDMCTTVNKSWAEGKCKSKNYELVSHLTGCYPIDSCNDANGLDMSDEILDMPNGEFDENLDKWTWGGFITPAVMLAPELEESNSYVSVTTLNCSTAFLARDYFVPGMDGGCGNGVDLSFWSSGDGDITIYANGNASNVPASASGWSKTTVPLGKLPAGENLNLQIFARVTKSQGCSDGGAEMKLGGFRIHYKIHYKHS
mmetsp:Transcript_13630/g.16468  ORF Transcript_13630/g.16468 Transcript_13630/m.16468 type:complete len:271 (+) Transcript_13630:217-1029(+)